MLKDRVAKLLNVKSIVTILLTILFGALAIRGQILSEVTTIYTMVIGFYFGTQTKKEDPAEK